ncbi:methyltransferase [Streptomyces abyssalis]|uniref:Methyltransferase n=1 Tax=Streptomyces abyssalis TaxID=933944 RepID=A0A1E7JRX8_9ACTN|nr:methyltransferase domain-containing protein [Streptomyces abyssalis]OEU91648.1 methyltransferase [Streptomyces abyssalis]OEU94215.1 methyltransferase [Streptomyces abyssalis]OEV28199.1 methyltransferase [Streptomyces nanshensis]
MTSSKSTPDCSFDAALDTWRVWQESPWGRLRYTLAEFNLQRRLAVLGPGPLRVLDLAGADGGDATRLLRRGHEVTVVDFSPGMLAAARERAGDEGTSGRLSTVEADVFDLPESVAGSRYDVVLCHNLLQYQDDPAPALRTAVPLVRGGGVLSVMAINRHAVPLGLAVRSLDPAAALDALDRRKVRGQTFDAELTLHTAEEVTALLAESGCTDIEHCGIRNVNDHIVDDARKHDPGFFAALEALELATTNRHPYPHTARIFQLLAHVT